MVSNYFMYVLLDFRTSKLNFVSLELGRSINKVHGWSRPDLMMRFMDDVL